MEHRHLLLEHAQRLLRSLREAREVVRLAVRAARLAPDGRAEQPAEALQPARAVVGGLPRLGELRYLELAGLARLHGVLEQLEVITHHGHLLLHVLIRLGRLTGKGVRE